MNLLPKSYSQFKEKIYWDQFFKNLKHQDPFQWYGSFQNYRENIFFTLMQLSQLNNKSKQFKIANIGCGNSNLAHDILTAYPAFSIGIDSFDYSQAVIADMQAKNNNKDKLTFSVCDMLKSLKEELGNHFDIVIDKGTLDAILPQDKPENIKEIEEVYFNNIKQMLKKQSYSSYVVISMLQPFILQTLLKSFSNDKSFTIKIHERFIPNSEVQPFLIQIRYSPTLLQHATIQIVLLNKAIITPLNISQALQEIVQLQKFNSYTKNIKQLRPGQLSKFNIFTQNNQVLRFMIEISDHHDTNILKKNSCSVFIVPQGMENLPIFNTANGVTDLQNQIGTSRLIVVKLVIGQKYKDLESIKNQLNPIIPNIIQKNCVVKQVPYLTDGSIGERHYLFEDQELFIEQILIQEQAHRRLILKNNISLVQSQFKLDYVSQKNHPHLKELQTNVIPHKKGLLVGIDHAHLAIGYSRFIVSAINRLSCNDWAKINVLHLGGGACAIPQYLYHRLENTSHTIVQSSKSIVKNCGKYFEWPQDANRFNVIHAEAGQFIQQLQQGNKKFEVIILDISNDTEKDAHYPPLNFLQAVITKKLKNLVSPNGLLLINTIKQGSEPKAPATLDYPLIFKSNLESENEIIVCVNRQFPHTIENDKKVFILDSNPLLDTSSWEEDKTSNLILVHPIDSTYKLAQNEKKKKKKKK